MKAERPRDGGAGWLAAERIRSNRSTSSEHFCPCGYPYVTPRQGGPRYCVPGWHPEPRREVLVRGSSRRPWWEAIGEAGRG